MRCRPANRARSPRGNSRTDGPSRQDRDPSGTARSKWPPARGGTAAKGGDAPHRSQLRRRKGAGIVGGPLVRGFVASRRRTTRPNPRKAKRAARKAPSRPGEEPPASPRSPPPRQTARGRQRKVAPRKVPSNRSAPPSSRMAGRNRPLCTARRVAGGGQAARNQPRRHDQSGSRCDAT